MKKETFSETEDSALIIDAVENKNGEREAELAVADAAPPLEEAPPGIKERGKAEGKKEATSEPKEAKRIFGTESKLSSHHLLHRGVLRLAGGKPFPSYFQRYFRFPPSAASVFSRVWIRDFRAFFRLRYADGNAHFQKAHSSQAQQMVSRPAPFDLLRKRSRPDFFGEMGCGLLFEKVFGIRAWNYENIPTHVTRYTSLITTFGFYDGDHAFVHFFSSQRCAFSKAPAESEFYIACLAI